MIPANGFDPDGPTWTLPVEAVRVLAEIRVVSDLCRPLVETPTPRWAAWVYGACQRLTAVVDPVQSGSFRATVQRVLDTPYALDAVRAIVSAGRPLDDYLESIGALGA